MTNEAIIMWEAVDLMEKGIIGTTGRTFEIEDKEGNKQIIQEPEPIHTFNGWKEKGYCVKKGEHAIASFRIWKYVTGGKKTDESEADGDAPGKGHCIMKLAFFFKASQVERITSKGAAA